MRYNQVVNKHGGKREGAGRKVSVSSQVRIRVVYYLTPLEIDRLSSCLPERYQKSVDGDKGMNQVKENETK
jgi:hypothetical protein